MKNPLSCNPRRKAFRFGVLQRFLAKSSVDVLHQALIIGINYTGLVTHAKREYGAFHLSCDAVRLPCAAEGRRE